MIARSMHIAPSMTYCNTVSFISVSPCVFLAIGSADAIDVRANTQRTAHQRVNAYDICVHGLDPVVQCHDDAAESLDAAHHACEYELEREKHEVATAQGCCHGKTNFAYEFECFVHGSNTPNYRSNTGYLSFGRFNCIRLTVYVYMLI